MKTEKILSIIVLFIFVATMFVVAGTARNKEKANMPSQIEAQESAKDGEALEALPLLPILSEEDIIKIEESNPVQMMDIDKLPPEIIPTTIVTLWVADGPGKPKNEATFKYIGNLGMTPQIIVPTQKPDQEIQIITSTPELTIIPPVAKFKIVQKETTFTVAKDAAFVEAGDDDTRWFAYKVDGVQPKIIIWQASNIVFDINNIDWENPAGLLKTGTVDVEVGEFSIDFNELNEIKENGISSISPLFSTSKQESIFVRAIAVDSEGNMMGSAGGIKMLYGQRLIDNVNINTDDLQKITALYDLLTARQQGAPSYNGEFPNSLNYLSEKYFDANIDSPLHFRPSGFPSATDTLILQVSTYPFKSDADSHLTQADIVYEKTLNKGTQEFNNLQDIYYTLPINFNDFFKGKATVYYVRATALTQGNAAGTYNAYYSKQVKVLCSTTNATKFKYYPPPEVVSIDMKVPDIELVAYQRLRWEASNWMYLYEVVRQPTYREYYGSIYTGNTDALMSSMPVGTIIDLTPSYREEDKSSWEEAWDAVSGFFSDMAGYAEKLVDYVKNAYGDIKAGAIAYVADHVPLVPEKYRDKLKDVLTVMVDTGLASMGIPPTLPNFEELTDLGIDYLATTALESAGVPANEITKDMVKQLGDGIADSVNFAATKGNSPNPMGWNFVRQNPSTMFRPAYMIVKVTNNSDKVSPPGEIGCTVKRTITQDDMNDPNISSIVAGFMGHREYDLFINTPNIPVPSLNPGESLEIPIILTAHIGHSYNLAYTDHIMTENDFVKMSKYFGKWDYNVAAEFYLPPIEETIENRNLPISDDVVYEYMSPYRGFSIENEQWNNFPRE